jgi:signal peptidase II
MCRLAAFSLAAAVFFLDRVTKSLIQARVSVWDTQVIVPGFFNIVHTENRGIAFGLLHDAPTGWPQLLLLIVSLAVFAGIAAMLWRSRSANTLGRTGLACVLGGALGNLYDRVLRGSVTDFLEFYVGSYVWPAFNVADTAICVGAGLLVLEMWFERRQPAHT